MQKIPLIVILGPTASGKTGLGIETAKRFNGEVVSADSMQIYKYMDIGTAKPTDEEQDGIPHYMISEIEPYEKFSVADYVKCAKAYIEDIYKRGKLPIIVGGTGLYIDSLTENRRFIEANTDFKLRKRLAETADLYGGDYLHGMLAELDSEAARVIDKQNIKRVIRAIEIYHTTGLTLTEQNERSKGEQIYEPYYFGIQWDRDELYQRIDERVDIMMRNGLAAEVVKLKEMGLDESFNSMQGIGYKQTLWYLKGLLTEKELFEIIKRDSRRYAKRQLTWFKKNDRITWIEGRKINKLDVIENSINIPVY